MHPLVIISHNNHAYVENTITQAEKFGLGAIVLDNASTYEKTRNCLEAISRRVRVIHLPDNFGYTCWSRPEIYDRLPDRFFLTDPDLQWNAKLPVDFPATLDALCSAFGARKVGFALDLGDSDGMFQDADYYQGKSIRAWEAQFWTRRIAHPLYEIYAAALDTTFQLFDKAKPSGLHLRVAGNFIAKHLPWYRETTISPHDLVHMYVSSRASTTAKLVLREMSRRNSLAAALDECRRSCSSPLSMSVTDVEAKLG
jgi:hypothetical protein